MSSVANKLAKAEAASRSNLAEISEKNLQLKKASEELEMLKMIKLDKNEFEHKKLLSAASELETENKSLKDFLKTHGLKWTDKNQRKANLSDFKTELDLEIVAKCINKLNDQFEKEGKYALGKDGAYRLNVHLPINC